MQYMQQYVCACAEEPEIRRACKLDTKLQVCNRQNCIKHVKWLPFTLMEWFRKNRLILSSFLRCRENKRKKSLHKFAKMQFKDKNRWLNIFVVYSVFAFIPMKKMSYLKNSLRMLFKLRKIYEKIAIKNVIESFMWTKLLLLPVTIDRHTSVLKCVSVAHLHDNSIDGGMMYMKAVNAHSDTHLETFTTTYGHLRSLPSFAPFYVVVVLILWFLFYFIWIKKTFINYFLPSSSSSSSTSSNLIYFYNLFIAFSE